MNRRSRPIGRKIRVIEGGGPALGRAAAAALLALVLVLPRLGAAAEAPAVSAPPAAAAPAPDAKGSGRVKEITVSRTPHFTNIVVNVEGKVESYNSFKLSDPFRIVLDIWGVEPGDVQPEIPVGTLQVKSLRVSRHEGKLRLTVETPNGSAVPFLVNSEDGKIELSVGGGEEGKVTSLARLSGKVDNPKGKPTVAGIDLDDLPGSANVVVTTSGKAPRKVVRKGSTVTLFFPGALTGKTLLKDIDASSLEGPVLRILPKRDRTGVTVTVRYRTGSRYEVMEKENGVVLSFQKTGRRPAGAPVARVTENPASPAPPAVRTVAEPPRRPADGPVLTGDRGKRWAFVTNEGEAARKYHGAPISMDFKDADLGNVLRIIAEVSNLNIVTSDDVRGKVTLRLENVPWDQALDHILRSKQLGANLEGNILRIAPLTSLRKEEKDRLDAKKEVEKIKATLEGEFVTIPVNYNDASRIKGMVEKVLSEGGKIDVDDHTNALVIRDLPKNVEEARSLIAKVDTPTKQVLIEARIVEVDTTYSHEVGVSWGSAWSGQIAGSQAGIAGIQSPTGAPLPGQPLTNSTPFSSATPVSYAVNLPAAIGLGSGGGISFGILRDNLRLDLSLSALEAAGNARVVSSPKVITIDNKEATISQGVDVPYSTVSSAGTQTQFKSAKLELKVKPHITPDGRIDMEINAKNDSVGSLGTTGVGINTKEAKTEVLIGDGETAVIGGIMQISRRDDKNAVPWFSKIPVLGFFFRKDSNSVQNRELLIFITPKVIRQDVEAKAKPF
jgi:type IV pilus assembly protein PilQ